jgi:hypothetical protein
MPMGTRLTGDLVPTREKVGAKAAEVVLIRRR